MGLPIPDPYPARKTEPGRMVPERRRQVRKGRLTKREAPPPKGRMGPERRLQLRKGRMVPPLMRGPVRAMLPSEEKREAEVKTEPCRLRRWAHFPWKGQSW